MQTGIGDSRSATEEEVKALHYQENLLIQELIDSDKKGTGPKVLKLAEIMEKLCELLDYDFTISQISTEIARVFRSLGCNALANHVRDYLPDKYKNPNLIRYYQHSDNIEKVLTCLDQGGAEEGRQLLEHSSNTELETWLEWLLNAKNNSDSIGAMMLNKIDKLREEGHRRGIELCGEKYREQISCYDFRMAVPNDQTLEWYNKQTSENLIATGIAIKEFGETDFLDFPPLDVDIAKKYTQASRVWRILFVTIREKKWSGDIGFWLDRNYLQKVQSSHDSGNSTKFPTTLCAWCSRDIDDDPKDYHIMHYDKTSPTTYRCDNCDGTAVLEKGNSREQVGDKKEENDMIAKEIIDHAPFYSDIFVDCRKRWLNPTIYARKRVISPEFSESAFGKGKIVVSRSKKE